MYLQRIYIYNIPVVLVVYSYNLIYPKEIKIHGSKSRGQEEAGLRDERVSYLQVVPL